MNNIWVVVQHSDGEIKPVIFEMLHAGQTLAGKTGGRVTAVVLDKNADLDDSSLFHYGADEVIVLTNDRLDAYIHWHYHSALVPFVQEQKPSLLLLPANNHGKELASSLAVGLDGGLATDCTAIDVHPEHGIQVTRPVYAGKSLSTVILENADTHILTLRPNVFRGAGPDTSRQGETRSFPVEISPSQLKLMSVEHKGGQLDITEAPILVSGGLGMEKPDNFQLLEDLAETLNGAVGASRPVVDEGWRDYSNQVGQTGRTVSPNLYIACGISGAVQHLAGMSSSKCIVAINKDPHAPIFQVADYGIVGNTLEVVPALNASFKETLGR